jgi:polyisoprenoid-binding protein YceI
VLSAFAVLTSRTFQSCQAVPSGATADSWWASFCSGSHGHITRVTQVMSHLLRSLIVVSLGIVAQTLAIGAQAVPAAEPLPVKVDEGSVSFEVATNVFSTTVRGRSTALAGRARLRDAGTALHLEQIEATVPVTSLRTGIKVRDEHMRKYIFETGDGQLIDVRFSASGADCPQASAADLYTCSASGMLSIRGTPRPLDMELKVSRNGDEFQASGDATIALSSYGIERPSQFGVRTDDAVRIHVEFKARSAAFASARAR